MNAIFNSSKSATVSRTLVLAICLAIAALGLAAVPTHKALANAPAPTVSSTVYKDIDHNGIVDTVLITFGTIAGNGFVCNYVPADWTYAGGADIGGAKSGGVCDAVAGTMTISISGAAANKTGAPAAAPTIQYTNNHNIQNTTGGATDLAAFGPTALTDAANPILVSVVKSATTSNILTFTYSENMVVVNGASSATKGDTTTVGEVKGFGTFGTAGNVTVLTTKNTVGGNGTPALTVTLANIAGGYLITPSTTEPAGAFTPDPAGVLVDAVGLHVSNAVTPTATGSWDLTKPAITSVTLHDAAGNNGSVDQAVVIFSKTMRGAGLADADVLLGGATHTGTFSAHADATTYTFNLTADTLAVNTSATAAQFTDTGATTLITDQLGNLLSTATPGVIIGTDIVETDGANPIMISATVNKTASRNTMTFVYSEPVTVVCDGASTAACGDLTAAGVFAGFTTSFGTPGDVTVPTTLNTVAGTGTTTVTITLADRAGGYINNTSTTGPSALVTPVAAAAVVDAALLQVNAAHTFAATVTSAWTLTQPTIASATLFDANYNGRVDRVTAVFSAPVRDASFTVANTTLGGGAGTFLNGTGGDTVDDNTRVFNITADVLPYDTSATAAQFLYSGTTTLITDLFGNLLNTATDGKIVAADIVEADGANPVIVTTSPADGGTGVVLDTDIVVTFSEPMNGPGTACTFSTSPDPGTFGAITNAANWSNGNKTVTLTHTSAYNRGDNPTITIGGCTAAAGSPTTLHTNAAVANPWTFAVIPSGSSAGNGSNSTPTPTVSLSIPVTGATYNAGQMIGLSWSSADGAFVNYRVSYSSNNGNTWSVLGTVSGTSYTWTVPTNSTTQGLIKVEGIGSDSTVLASATSGAFTVAGTTVAPPAVAPPDTVTPPAVDPTIHGSYTAAAARANNPTIADDKALTPVSNANCTAGSLIKGSLPAVYYCGVDGKRYVFVNDKAYFSWYPDFSGVRIVSDATLASITIGGNITYRPGMRMVKIQSDPKVYAVARGGVLRWIQTEAAAVSLYGANWNTMIDDVADSFFVNYVVGSPIAQ